MLDASAVVEYLLRTEAGDRLRNAIEADDADLHIPALCDVEVVAAMREALRKRRLTYGRAAEALEIYGDLPILRHGHLHLTRRMFELRDNFSAYDAVYVTLAEDLGATLVTADLPLAAAVRRHVRIKAVTP